MVCSCCIDALTLSMSLSCWIRSVFVKGWKEVGGDSSFDGEDILCMVLILVEFGGQVEQKEL